MKIAHIAEKPDGTTVQDLKEHLEHVALLCSGYMERTGCPSTGYLVGLMHDAGKAGRDFQNRMEAIRAGQPDPGQKGGHASGGAVLLNKIAGNAGESGDPVKMFALQAMCEAIFSHHASLPDNISPKGEDGYLNRMNCGEEELQEIEAYFREEIISGEKLQELLNRAYEEAGTLFRKVREQTEDYKEASFFLGMFQKMLLSALVDADWLDSALSGGSTLPDFPSVREKENDCGAEREYLFRYFLGNLEKSLQKKNSSAGALNVWRNYISKGCKEAGSRKGGIYTLSCPTGAGKTLASLRFALTHCVEQKKCKIFYIIPYLSIIDQTVKSIRAAISQDESDPLVEDNILELHSNAEADKAAAETAKVTETDQTAAEAAKVTEVDQTAAEAGQVTEVDQTAAETDKAAPDRVAGEKAAGASKENACSADSSFWTQRMAEPVVITTMVRFLNTFFAEGTRNLRPAHQFQNAVIIFDEIQTLPIRQIALFNSLINFLSEVCGCTCVLCTATQPLLGELEKPVYPVKMAQPPGLVDIPEEAMDAFKRVQVKAVLKSGGYSGVELAEFAWNRAAESGSVLVIMNTKQSAYTVYNELIRRAGEEFRVYYLSTRLYAAHRKEIIEEIRAALAAEEKIAVVSTQLIEAGIDFDFSCVIRSLAGMDSIVQAAGRCNREGKREMETTYIVNPDDKLESLVHLKDIREGARQTDRLLSEFDRKPEIYDQDLLSEKAIHTYS